ncbi:MAG: hypothetical protein COT17_08315 [Elusimicrobia bacterium CG08_land_8_20_14_0_20_51_18]|nr:MAG: hypothetical protein COT17_08315 [Elusimicrobia bacterium CG08_land_8_20_14_0_20_51_18]
MLKILFISLTAIFFFLGFYHDQNWFYAALVSFFAFFRTATGSMCPGIWLLSKLGARGLSCPAQNKPVK